MQSFFNDADEKKGLIELTNTVFKIIIEDLESRSSYRSVPPNVKQNLWNTVHKLVKIASEQNKLLLQFPAILAYFVYNFLQNIDLDELEHVNEILDDIQRLIERKKLQGLSFNTVKQILQQELQKRKSRSERQQEQGKKEGGEGEEGEQREQEPGEESGESNEQEQEGEESEGGEEEGEGKESQSGEGGEEGESESEGNQEEGEEGETQEGGERGEEAESQGEEQQGWEEGEEQGSENGGEQGQESGEEEQSGEEGNEWEQGNAQEGQGLGEEGGSEEEQGGEGNGEEQELGEEEGEESGNEGQNGEEQEGQNSGEEGQETEGEQQSGEGSGNKGEGGGQGGVEEGEESEGGEGEGQQGEGDQGKQNGERGQGTEDEGQKGAGGGQGAEDVFEDLERDIDDKIMVLDLLEDSLQKALSALSIGKDSGGGILKEANLRVLELLERANRILTLANQVDLQYANSRGVKDQGGVMKGITTGNNLKHLFKSQLILPDEVFLERYTNRALLQRAVESEGIGDFYFIIDKSGSMDSEMPNGYTAFENVSAVALASAMEAEKSNRKVFVQYFDDSTTEPIDVNNVLELARIEPGGGTDMMVALREFMEYYNNYPGLKDVKQVFIMSDFETGYDRYTLEDFKNFAKNNGLIVTCLHVYKGRVPPDMQEIIDEICDEYYKFNDYDASELFSVVYKKV